MKLLTLLTILLVPFITQAKGFPSWYPTDGFRTGKVVSITPTNLSFDDEFYILSPTVKISTLAQKKAALKDIKKGDKIGLKMIEFNGKIYVDHIYQIYVNPNDIVR